MIFGLTACTTGEVKLFGNEKTEIVYRTDRNVYLPAEKLRTLNPLISKDEDYYYISKLIYNGLFELDEELIPQPVLARDYAYDESRTELVIDLNRGIKWQDGEEFTGDDVKFTVEAIINLAKSNLSLYGSHVSNIKSVSVSEADPYKVTIKFYYDTNVGVENLIFPIIPAHTFRNVSAVRTTADDFKPIGTGQYRVSEYRELSRLSLIPNENYFGEKAGNTLNFEILPKKSYAVNMTETGDISLFTDKTSDRDTILSRYELSASSFVSNEIELIGFNFRNEHLRNAEVRKAVSYAVDTNGILAANYMKNGQTTDSLFYPGYYGMTNGEDAYPYDLEKAEELLQQAGYRDYDENGYIENEDGVELSLKILVNESNAQRYSAAQTIKTELDKLQIYSVIDACSDELYRYKLQTGEFDMYLGGYSIDERWDLRPMLHTGQGNYIAYSNATADACLTNLVSGLSQSQKKANAEQLRQIMVEDVPYYCMFFKTYGCFSSKYFDGETAMLFNDIYRNCGNWSCKYVEDVSR